MTRSIEQRLRALEDRLEIIELEATYARAFDERDGDTWSSLFTEDGIYQSRAVGEAPPLTFVQGRPALHAFCADAAFAGIHFLHLPQLAFDGDRATARIHLEFHGDYAEDAGAPRLVMRGFYDVAYRREGGPLAHRPSGDDGLRPQPGHGARLPRRIRPPGGLTLRRRR